VAKQQKVTFMNNIISLIKKYGRTAIEVIGLIGIVLALLQLNLQQQQFTYEKLQKPNLEYSYTITLSKSDQKIISDAAESLIEEFYKSVFQKTENTPNAKYIDIAESILPLEKTIAPRPLSISVKIINTGVATATKVHVICNIGRPITSISVNSLEPSQVIQGGDGKDFATIEIDRLVAGDSATIDIVSNDGGEGQSDTVVIQSPSDFSSSTSQKSVIKTASGNTVVLEYSEASRIIRLSIGEGDSPQTIQTIDMKLGNGSSTISPLLPQIGYIPAQQPSIQISVTSNEGSGVKAVTPIP